MSTGNQVIETISIKIEKQNVTFELSFDNNMFRVKDIETTGIVLDGYFLGKQVCYHQSHQSIRYFAEDIKTKIAKSFKKHKLIK